MDKALPLADELAAVFARMSGLLLSQETVSTALALVTSLAKETIPGTAGAGVTLLDSEGRKVSAAATDPLVERADALQYELGEGPCLSAFEQRAVFRIVDMQQETRWPRWVKAVQPLGMGATLSTPLVSGDMALGAMKVYGRASGVYGSREEHLVAMFAAQAAVLLANAQAYENARQLSEELVRALRTRDEISIAKGVLMARDRIDEKTAFAMLVAISRRQNRKLTDVASALVRSTVQQRR
jgi:GAF domain-containing protein